MGGFPTTAGGRKPHDLAADGIFSRDNRREEHDAAWPVEGDGDEAERGGDGATPAMDDVNKVGYADDADDGHAVTTQALPRVARRRVVRRGRWGRGGRRGRRSPCCTERRGSRTPTPRCPSRAMGTSRTVAATVRRATMASAPRGGEGGGAVGRRWRSPRVRDVSANEEGSASTASCSS